MQQKNHRPSKTGKTSPPELGRIRIIAGQWRSRRFYFPVSIGLRPTPNRVRETLFNWLAPHIEGTYVLDVCTGSGALLLEALSRGATQALGLDHNQQALTYLQEHLQKLECQKAKLQHVDARIYLAQQKPRPFDLVFLDPPFGQALLLPLVLLLEERGWLSSQAWIYCESEQAPQLHEFPKNWQLYRQQKAGQVHYMLWQRSAP